MTVSSDMIGHAHGHAPKMPREEVYFLLLLRRTEERCSEFASEGNVTDKKVVYFVAQLDAMLQDLENHAQ